ncbi:universal stress protein [Halomicroarcula sp. GCM10025709]|uniref:universal stress protein n=1 Tax=Haloarcula TaxID=2237 RepID=UPI0024C3C9FA|nr:universal stress protein [Halomicroarcula sp. YJ-61-S]
MGKRILVPVDGSDGAAHACEFAAEEFPDATLVLLHVINPAEAGYSAQASVPSFSEQWYEQQESSAEELFDRLDETIRTAGGGDTEHALEVGRPTKTIVDYADDHDIDHIVMGSHGRSGVSRILLGSVAEIVVRRATVPVTVVR